MKKINLIKRLWTDSHEKQSPQRFARYAAMLIMLLTLGVGQTWGGTKRVYCKVANSDWQAAGAKVNVHYWGGSSAGTTWPGAKMTASGTANVYYADIPDDATFCFCRTNPAQDTDWGHKTGDLSFPASPASGLNLYEITSSDKPSDGQWANIGFESTGGNDIKFYDSANGNQTWDISSATGASATKDLGTITILYLKGWDMKMYQNMDAAIVDGTDNRWLYYNIHRSAVSPGVYSSKTLDEWNWPGWDGGYRKPSGSKSCDDNLLTGLGSGKYSMTFYLQHNGLINFYLNNGGSNYNLKWTIGVPSVSGGAVTSNGTGTGEEGSPFSVADGNTITFTASGSQASTDANSVLYVKWGDDAYSSTTTKTITPTTTKQSMTVKLKYYNSADGLSGAETTLTIYYQSTLTPSIGISSISPSPANSGDEVTITASRQNAGEANITYQYSLNGESGWTTIGSATSSTTKTWTVPAITTTTTYYFRAQMTYSATTYTSDVVSLKAYGKKTIKVKNTNGWYPFYMHRWGGDRADTSFPGEDDQISDYGSGQWKQVVLYSSNNNFIFVDGTNTSNKNSDQTYAGVTDGACYEIASGTGVVALNSTLNCPAKPSVSTTAPTGLTNTSVTMNGNIVGNGNDALTEYGFYFGASPNPSAIKYIAGTTGNFTGAISQSRGELTSGNTYYYRTFATNGQGTTYGEDQSFVVPYSVTITKPTGCSTITPGTGTQYIKVGDVITATAANGYEFSSWSLSGVTLSSPTTIDGVTSSTVTAASNGGTIQPVYTAKTYTGVTLDKNTGSSDGAYSVTYLDNKITVTTTPAKTGYHVDGYYAEAGTTTYIATAAGALQSGKYGYTDGSGRWNQAGGKKLYTKWAANTYTAENNIDGNGGSAGKYTATYDATSIAINTTPTRTGYNLTGYHAWGREANTLANTEGALTASQSENGNGNRALTDASNHWIYDNTDAVIYADWSPKTYSISLDQEGGASGSTSVTMTYDASTHTAITNPSKTGYTFGGYWTGDNGTGSMVIATDGTLQENVSTYTGAGGIWIKDATCTLYAKWTANNYTITLTQEGETGYGSDGENSSVTATYDAALPAMGSAPTGAPGYKFQGYYTDHNGGGTQYYDADGTKKVASYTTAGTTTLYAYFMEAEITSLEHETSVAKAEEAELVVNPVLNVVPEDYIAICWTLHYADNDNPVDGEHWDVEPHTENGDKPYQVKYTFTNLASGSYYVKATLRKSAGIFSNVCTDGTKMMDIHGDFHVVGNNTVTVRYMTIDLGSDFVLKAPTEVEVEAMNTVEVPAPEIPGYTFTRWSIGDGISTSDAVTANPITISATYDGVLTARYTKKQVVYFNNTLGWEDVYVYFYNDASGNQYWANNYGTGANKQQTFGEQKPYWEQEHGHMTQIEGTNIWYFDFKAAGYSTTRTKVAFANVEQSIDKSGATNDEAYFHNASVVYRTDFDAANLPMFVPINAVQYDYTANTGSKYYRGYWMNYPESTGYELRFYNKRATDGSGAPYELIAKRHKFEFTGDKTLPMSVSLDLEAGHDYFFKIYRVDDTYYGNNGQMTNGHSGDEGQPAWEFKTETENAWVTASGAGNYTFTLRYGEDFKGAYNYLVGVRYPESTGDFRVMYSDAVRVSTHESDEGKSWLASYVIPKTSESDTVSYFVRRASSPKIKAQKCTATYEADVTTVTWADENGGADLLPDTISADGVYNFIFTKEDGELVLTAVEPYKGNFYIRVDGAGTSNWDNFRSADHLMPYSDYSFKQEDEPYSHYFTQWYEPNPDGKPVEPKNIKFVVANDYSACVSDTIVRDGIADIYVDENGWLSGRNANIRFMYNYKTNAASRRYIDGAQESGSEFLVLLPSNNESIYNAETDGTPFTQVTFTDKGNWIYEANVWVVPGTDYKLRSKFGDGGNIITQYFKGDEDTYEKLIEGSGSSRLQIRLLYDFKTNRLVSAYIPSSTISSDLAINADVMFIREGQGEMQQLTFENNATLSAITNVYSVLRFNKWTLNNRYTDGGHGLILDPKSIYERSLYFVSFPFDVKLSDVFGFGTYWDEWYIEYYDGEARAKNGFWIDSESYWKYVTPAMKDTFTLKAGQGYIFGLDLDYLHCEGEGEGQQANVWKNIQTADFIFPGNVSSISNSSVTYTLPAHTCTINRGTASGNRTIADSHWNVLGVPTYLNTTSVTFEETTGDWMTDGKPKYIYSWNPQDNSLSPTSAADFTYHSMNAYVVQYYGNVTFSTSVSPTAAPRRNPEYRGEYEFRLEIQQNEQTIDHTFIRLTDDEEATVNFEFGLDLTKSINANKANIYTIVEGYLQAAGNCLPLTDQTTVVPVGVIAKTTGDYTFSIPEGTEGVGVTLIDNETGIRTSLSALDYNINLNAGTYDNRFVLEISPIVQSPTDIDAVSNQQSAVRKVMIDGLLYIVKDGVMYDAQGKRLQ